VHPPSRLIFAPATVRGRRRKRVTCGGREERTERTVDHPSFLSLHVSAMLHLCYSLILEKEYARKKRRRKKKGRGA